MERRGRIPVAKFRTQEGKTRSRSRVREPDYNEQDPETDLFTLLEDNIALKEENKELKSKIEDHKKSQDELLEEKGKVHADLELLKEKQRRFDERLNELTAKYTKVSNERNALDKLHKMKMEKINSLTTELQLLRSTEEQLPAAIVCSSGLKSKMLKVLPTLSSNEMESLIDVESSAALPITSELVERLVDEFFALKNSMSSVELQLYEANEKIAELVENQHHLEEENDTFRTENTNLTKVAKLLTENMKESVETSKKMEIALVKLKQRNDELTAKARDLTDGLPAPSLSPTTVKANEEFEQIKEEVQNQNRDHGERIVEMKNLVEAAIQKNTNDELNTFKLKLEILEEELRKAISRAELAECELEKYKNRAQDSDSVAPSQAGTVAAQPPPPPALPPPPPPPPPMPATLLYRAQTVAQANANAAGSVDADSANVCAFSDSIAMHNLHKGKAGDKIIATVKQQVQPAATGLDALVREFKSGRVTLRRNRRKTRTNEALQEMFQVLEISQTQNRNSKLCIDMHI